MHSFTAFPLSYPHNKIAMPRKCPETMPHSIFLNSSTPYIPSHAPQAIYLISVFASLSARSSTFLSFSSGTFSSSAC